MNFVIKMLRTPILYLAIIVGIFFFLYSFPRINAPLINFSPDENANYYFSRLFAEETTLKKYEALNENIEPIVHPRSINVNRENYLVPGSFLGLPLIYGLLGKILSPEIIIFLTPLFSCISILFFYGIIKKVFSWQVAFLSAILTLSHPIFWYYSTRSMFHNVLFFSFLIIGFYFLITFFQGNSGIYGVLSGLFIGMGLMVRPVELPWIFIALLIIYLFYRKYVKLIPAIIIILAIIATGMPILYFNRILYGGHFITGYANLHNNLNILTKASEKTEAVSTFFGKEQNNFANNKLVFAAGNLDFFNSIKQFIRRSMPTSFSAHLNLKLSVENFRKYFINFCGLLSALFFLGFASFIACGLLNILAKLAINYFKKRNEKNSAAEEFLQKRKLNKNSKISKHNKSGKLKNIDKMLSSLDSFAPKREALIYAFIFFIISLYLVFYYGSWLFYDTPDKSLITIGTSYTRYWLPIYVLSIPFIAYFLINISKFLIYKFPKFLFLSFVILVVTFYNAGIVFYSPNEGIVKQIEGAIEYSFKKGIVINSTEDGAVIVNQYYDKLFFPERKVICSKLYNDKNVLKSVAYLIKQVPVYYYSFGLKQEDIDYLNRNKLAEVGIKLENGMAVWRDEMLWKIKNID